MRKPNEFKEPPEDKVGQKWIRTVRKHCRENVGGIIKIGEDLIKAQIEVGYGRWGLLFNDGPPFTDDVMPFCLRDAERYMAIAAHPFLKDSTNWSNLPQHYRTLERLVPISPERLAELKAQGRVHTEMTGQDAERLVRKDTPKRVVSKAPRAELRALEVMVDAMDEVNAEALAADLIQLVEDEDKACDVLERLPEVARFISKLAEAYEQAAIEKLRARKAERKVAKGKGKELHCTQDA